MIKQAVMELMEQREREGMVEPLGFGFLLKRLIFIIID
jgi:predicted xylose isomerase-like sugar epimerase